MRALKFDGRIVVLDQRAQLPVAQAGEAVIRTTKGAFSALDLEICKGLVPYKGTLGHEFVGVVESLAPSESPSGGDKVAGKVAGKAAGRTAPKLIGQRVVGSISSSCGKCDMCLAGLGPHCRHRTLLGIAGREGCLADSFTLPVRNLSPVPDSVDDDHALFAHTLAAAIQASRQVTMETRPFVTVLGDGPLGLLTAQVLARMNASVRVVGRHAEKLALCEKWQIKHRHADDVGRRADQDVVVDCSGSPGGLELAIALTRPRGMIILKSLYAPSTITDRSAGQAHSDWSTIVWKELHVAGSHGGPVAEALTMLAQRQVDVVGLISKRMKLNDGDSIAKMAAQPGIIRVVVEI